MRRTSSVVASLALVFAALIVAPSAVVSAHPTTDTPQGFNTTEWAWVVVRDGTSTYTPAAKDRGNASGAIDRVKVFALGVYEIKFKGEADLGGVAHVSVLGTKPRVCVITTWFSKGADELVDIDCFSRTGSPAAATFVASFLATDNESGKLGYLWADEPQAASGDYTAAGTWSFNSTGGTNLVDHESTGRYLVTLPNLGAFKGDVQVSAFVEFPTPVRIAPAGNVPYNGPLSVCDTAGWTEGGGDTNMYVSVDCRDVTGALTDSYFTMTFMQGLGLKGISGTGVAYGLADQPTTASYAAPSDYRFSAPAGTVHVTRQGTGRYTVTFSAMPEGGAVLVSADTISARRCFVGSIDTAATPQKVTVRCIKFDGTPANSRFTIAYER